MKKFKKNFVLSIGVIVALVLFFAIILSLKFGAHKITDAEKIAWCESANESSYADVKAELTKIVEKTTRHEPQKMVVHIASDGYDQFCTAYFQTEDGTWYEKEVSLITNNRLYELVKRDILD